MKALFINSYPVFEITAIVTHIWTAVIAFQEGGLFSGIISLVLPGLSELYWIFRMFGDNDVYVFVVLLHLVLAISMSRARRGLPY